MFKTVLAPCLVSLAFASVTLQAQDVFTVPGANSSGQDVSAFTGNPFSPINGFLSGTGTFMVLAKPDGSTFYSIANSTIGTITAVDSTFSTTRSLGNLAAPATGAAISPDGSRLVVAAGKLHVFDTATDNELVPGGISPAAGLTVFDVAYSLDGTRILALGTEPVAGSELVVLDASSNVALGSLQILGTATGLAIGPNGLAYISTQSEILEVNPKTIAVTLGGLISMNAHPGRVVFTPDGKYALAVNQEPVTGSAILLISLATRTLVGSLPTSSLGGNTVDQLLVAGPTTVFGLSSLSQSLYQISIASGNTLGIAAYSLLGPGFITAAAFSNEVPTPQYLFATGAGTLSRVDMVSNAVSQAALGAAAGGISFAGAAATGTPVTLLTYGNSQTIAPSSTSGPLVVRVLNASGVPISGATVTFTTPASGASVSPTSAVSSHDGYGLTYLTAPSTAGPVIVTASAGTKSAEFLTTVGTPTGGTAPNVLSIIAGQGQLVSENVNTGLPGFGSPLVVQVSDSNGKALSGVTVTYTITQGSGSIKVGTNPNSNSLAATSGDATKGFAAGQVSVNFVSPQVPLNGTDFTQTAITVSAPGTNSVNFYISTTPQSAQASVILRKPNPGDTLTGSAGSTLPGAVVAQVTSSLGFPMPNVGMFILNAPGSNAGGPSAQCANPTGLGVLSDGTGTLSCDLVLNEVLGEGTVLANIGYALNTSNFHVMITPGVPSQIQIVQGNNQSGSPGQRLPVALLARVTDPGGVRLAGVPVTWSVLTPNSVVLSNESTVTDLNGDASATATLGNIAGPLQVTVKAGTLTATFLLNVVVSSAGIVKVSGDAQNTPINAAFPAPIVVEVVDANQNPVPGVQVTFQVVSGSAVLGTPIAVADATGQAGTTVTAGATPGAVTISATANGFIVNFTLTVNGIGPTNITFANGASFQVGVISPGGIATITGEGIAPGVTGLISAYNLVGPLPISLAGVSITFNGIPAPIYYVLNLGNTQQVTVQVPFEVPAGAVSVTINAAGGGSVTVPTVLEQFGPGVFNTLVNGTPMAVAVRPDGSYVTADNPAQRDEDIQVFVTGLGPVSPDAVTGNAGLTGQTVVASVIVGLNNGGVPLTSAVYAPGMVGVYILTLHVPATTTPGPSQPFGLLMVDLAGHHVYARGAFIPIQ
jgi:uncharacterized protein (TIGR03437 family)